MRTINPKEHKSYHCMMLEICEGCKFNIKAKTFEEYMKNSETCYPCYGEMKRKYELKESFEIDW